MYILQHSQRMAQNLLRLNKIEESKSKSGVNLQLSVPRITNTILSNEVHVTEWHLTGHIM